MAEQGITRESPPSGSPLIVGMVGLAVGAFVVLFGMWVYYWSTPDAQMVLIAEKIVRLYLRDPDSAKFTDVSFRMMKKPGGGDMAVVCGDVNARNGFGGMTGAQPFAVVDGEAHFARKGPEERKVIRTLCGM